MGRLLGLLAAIVLGLNTTFARLAYDAGSNPVTVLGSRYLACALTIGIAVILLIGGIALPQNTSGWTGLSGAAFGFGVGILAMFTAIKHVGSVATAMLLNFEPLISILAAAVVLGERLTVLQFIGAIMVVSALILSTRESAKHG